MKVFIDFIGKNNQISLFFEIIIILSLFEKYLAVYHFLKLKFHMELKFTKIEFLKSSLGSRDPCDITTLSLPFSHTIFLKPHFFFRIFQFFKKKKLGTSIL